MLKDMHRPSKLNEMWREHAECGRVQIFYREDGEESWVEREG